MTLDSRKGDELYRQALANAGYVPRPPKIEKLSVSFTMNFPTWPGEKDMLRDLVEKIAQKHDLTFEQVLGRNRYGECVEARRECYQKAHQQGYSAARIGRFFKRNHTTILHALYPNRKYPNMKRRGA